MSGFGTIKRKVYPVELGEGQKFFVRALTPGEIEKVKAAEGKTFTLLLQGLCDQNGEAVLVEADEATFNDVPLDVSNALADAIMGHCRSKKD